MALLLFLFQTGPAPARLQAELVKEALNARD
jgi:hypothetical protein